MIVGLFLLATVTGVAAFSPASNTRAAMSLSAKSKSVPFLEQPPKLDGSMAGDRGFDPAGFTNAKRFKYTEGSDSLFGGWTEDIDWAENVVPENAMMWGDAKRSPITTVEWMREAELKHGRFCMLATLGWIAVDLGLRFPGDMFAAIPNSLAAHDLAVENGSMKTLLMFVSFCELMTGAAIFEQAKGSGRKSGDFSFDPLMLSSSPDKKKDYEEKEINNARLAMLAFSGIVTQAALHPDVAFPYV